MLREERGMTFAVGAMRRGLEVGGRWEKIGVEESRLAHELTWNVEIDVVEDLDITRIAHQFEHWSRKKEGKNGKDERGREALECVNCGVFFKTELD
jgi:hypothetical protein